MRLKNKSLKNIIKETIFFRFMTKMGRQFSKGFFNVTALFLILISNLIDEISSWNIFFNYFIYKLDPREEGSGWIYIMQLLNEMATIKV